MCVFCPAPVPRAVAWPAAAQTLAAENSSGRGGSHPPGERRLPPDQNPYVQSCYIQLLPIKMGVNIYVYIYIQLIQLHKEREKERAREGMLMICVYGYTGK